MNRPARIALALWTACGLAFFYSQISISAAQKAPPAPPAPTAAKQPAATASAKQPPSAAEAAKHQAAKHQAASAEFSLISGFVKQHCFECHGDKDPQADLNLRRFADEQAIVQGRKTWDNVLRMIASGEMPPPDAPRPDANRTQAFTAAIKTVFERAERERKPDPGHVTIRRLNRVEYANTIRDLIGFDFNPAEDFPADDIGYGFDNIGEVLTLSPVLMERYLAAAEGIMQQAIVPNPPKPTQRHTGARYSEPASDKVPLEKNWRILSLESPESAIHTGPIFSSYANLPEGEYLFRCRMYGQAEGDRPIQFAILACAREMATPASDEEADRLVGAVKNLRPFVIVHQGEVTATDARKAQTVEVKLPPISGLRRMAIALVKPAEVAAAPKLFVESLVLTGPLDMRPASHHRLLNATATETEAKVREAMSRFLLRAFRRPPTAAEADRYVQMARGQLQAGKSYDEAMQFALTAVLVSPKFLFRVETDPDPQAAGMHPIDEYQLAARLSYFLWCSTPDDELLALAGKRELTANLDPQVRRMLQDPKSAALVKQFALQWLQLQRLQIFSPDPQTFPAFNEPLRAAMLKETELFFDAIVREDRPITELLSANFTFLNERLARHYGIIDTQGNKYGQKPPKPGGQQIRGERFVRVNLQGEERGGLLTQASVLAVTPNPTRTSPVKRGKWVLEQILGAPPPPPPPNVPELEQDEKAVLTGTLRQRMEQHRANPSCANCHAKMDPLGFAFENYDAIGAYRTKDGDFPIDASGTLPDGREVQGPQALKQILLEKKDQFAECLAEKLLIFALGRGLEYYDRPTIQRITAALPQGDYRFSTLVSEIVKSDPFRMRRGREHLASP